MSNIPSIAMMPNAYKSGKVYSVLPSDGSGDLNFERASEATRVNKNGLIETVGNNVPRIDYTDGGCPKLLLEPQRTNLILNSQAISLSPTKNGTFTDNFAVSPDGTQNATKIVATDIDPFFYQSLSFTAASYTASIYVKGVGNSIGKNFEIRLGVNTSGEIEIPSEWTRIEYTATMTSGSGQCGIEIPNPAVIGDEVLVWGWQVEQGSYATSYIPTNGATATRNAETLSKTGLSNYINSSEGVLYAEISALADDNVDKAISISSGSIANRVSIRFTSNKRIRALVFSNSTLSFNYETTEDININQYYKIALKYKENDFALWVNGVELATDNLGNAPLNLTDIVFDVGNGSSNFYGKVKDLRVYNQALTDTELQNLTS